MNKHFWSVTLAGAVSVFLAGPAPANLIVTQIPAPGDFVMSADGRATALLVETNTDRAVLRAVKDLAADFAQVAGARPEIITTAAGKKNLIVVGTLGQSGMLDRLVAGKKLDASGVRGQWESWGMQIVKNPLPGVDTALVIAGSDRRGTIYGIYTLSEMIGVSPWYWWADVPVKHAQVLALHGAGRKQGPPAVKYRGIFLNDEDWCLRPWAARTFDPETGNIGPKTYAKVFELLLRLHANYLWPAMHPGTAAFNLMSAIEVVVKG